MLRIGFTAGVDGFLCLDAAKQLTAGKGDVEIDLIGIRNEEKSYDILILNKFREDIDYSLYISLMRKGGILLLNSDEKSFRSLALIRPVELVTYGLNPKSSITASSIVESEFTTVQCCVQRAITDIEGGEICPQEFAVNVYEPNINVTDALSVVSAAVLAGVSFPPVKNFPKDSKLLVR